MKKFLVLTGTIVLVVFVSLNLLAFQPWESHYTDESKVFQSEKTISFESILNRYRAPSTETGTSGKDIILITLDTLRADHLSSYGYFKKTSPFLDSLAEEGVLFTRAYAPSGNTAPSHATILSGLYPIQHRIMKNGHKMSLDIETMPELLQKAGYKTAGITSIPRFWKPAHIAQGFDFFNQPTDEETMIKSDNADQPRPFYYRPAERTLSHAQNWIKNNMKNDDKSTFLWIHLFDPHNNLVYREDYYDLMTPKSPEQREQYESFIRENHHFELDPLVNLGGENYFIDYDDTRKRAYRKYDAEIRYMDDQLKKFYDFLERTGARPDLSIVAGDHGQGNGNHNWWFHGKNIYNEQVRIPFIMHWKDKRHRGSKIDTVIELNDIAPTILYEAGVNPATIDKHRQLPIEGSSLQRLIKGERSGFGYAFVQRRAFDPVSWWEGYIKYVRNQLGNTSQTHRLATDYESGRRFALINSKHNYMYATEHTDEFYNLRNDFYQQQNLIREKLPQRDIMASTVVDLISVLENSTPFHSRDVDEKTQKALEGLGYIQ